MTQVTSQVLAERQHLLQPAARGEISLARSSSWKTGVCCSSESGLRGQVGGGDQRPQVRRLRLRVGVLGLPRQEGPLDAEHLVPRLRRRSARSGRHRAGRRRPRPRSSSLTGTERVKCWRRRRRAWRTSRRTCRRPPCRRRPAGSRCASARVSMAERPSSGGPTRRPTWASVTVCLPLLVTVPETVSGVALGRGAGAERVEGRRRPCPDPVASAAAAVRRGVRGGDARAAGAGRPAGAPRRAVLRCAAATGGQVRDSSPGSLPPRPRARPSLVVVSGRRNVRPRMVTMCAERKCRGPLPRSGTGRVSCMCVYASGEADARARH